MSKLHTVLGIASNVSASVPLSNKHHRETIASFSIVDMDNVCVSKGFSLPLINMTPDLIIESRRQAAALSLRKKFKTLLRACKPPVMDPPVQAYERHVYKVTHLIIYICEHALTYVRIHVDGYLTVDYYVPTNKRIRILCYLISLLLKMV